jgi:serine/threonine protein kinase
LQHLHEQGLVHRDLKPGNLMLVPAHMEGKPDHTLQATVKIMDIGLGRALFDEGTPGGAGNFQLTNEGTILGTPDYLAPEQARDARQADVRADIYSLGCGLYHALTGQPPFVETNLVRQLVRHATETPRPLRDLDPTIPEGLQPILNMMLAKDPASRYPTPERAAQALQAFLAGDTGVPPTSPGPAQNAYFTWLDSQPLPPEGVAAPPGKARTPDPSPAPPGQTLDAFTPVAVVAPQAPLPKAPAAISPPRPAPPPAQPRQTRPPVPRKPKPADLVEDQAEGGVTNLVANLGRRDLLMMAIGAGVLLVVELFSFLAGYLLVRLRGDSSDEPGEGSEETHTG